MWVGRPTSSRSSSARWWRSAVDTFRTRRPKATLSRALRCGKRLYDWNTMPASRRLAGDPGDVLPVHEHFARVGVFEAA